MSSVPASGDTRTFAILGAAMTVHRALGSGFLECIYLDALAIEFELRQIPFASEVRVAFITGAVCCGAAIGSTSCATPT